MDEPAGILVHSCCASCAGYVLEHLSGRFKPTAFFYNPNIEPEEEYRLRLAEMAGICAELGIEMIEGEYEPGLWREAVSELIVLPEGSARCRACYRLRLERTALEASGRGLGLYTTTLSVSPHKTYRVILEEGRRAAGIRGIRFLEDNFRKKDGFLKSCIRSRELGLTRQDYCGCLPSLEEASERRRRRGINPL